jgi:predicted enzyme related to lactoylglutathione lyase
MSKPDHPAGAFCWFECVPMPGDMQGHYTLLKVGDEDTAGLYQLAGPQFEGVPSNWTTYVKVDSADQTVERATALGATGTPPMDVPGVGRIAFVQDPTGAHIGLFQPGEHPGSAQPGSVEGAMGWSELATRDTEKAKAFYTELFNWGAKVDDAGPMSYTEFQVGGKSIGGMMEMTQQHGDAPPHWLPYVLVDDCNASAGKVTELGGNILVPPTDVPNVGRFAVFTDPTGACLAIIKLTMQTS